MFGRKNNTNLTLKSTLSGKNTPIHLKKSDSKKFVPAFWNIRGKKELFISHEIVIEYFHSKSVPAFQLDQGDMFRT